MDDIPYCRRVVPSILSFSTSSLTFFSLNSSSSEMNQKMYWNCFFLSKIFTSSLSESSLLRDRNSKQLTPVSNEISLIQIARLLDQAVIQVITSSITQLLTILYRGKQSRLFIFRNPSRASLMNSLLSAFSFLGHSYYVATASAMAPLINLQSEILHFIANGVRDKRDMLSLASCCPRLRQLALPYCFTSLWLECPCYITLCRLIMFFYRNPDVGRAVQDLQLDGWPPTSYISHKWGLAIRFAQVSSGHPFHRLLILNSSAPTTLLCKNCFG